MKTEIVELALDKMLNDSGHFSICAVDKLADLLGSNPKLSPHYKALRALHCVDYSKMSKDLLVNLPKMIMSCLSSEFDASLMSRALMAVHNREINDLPLTEDDCPTIRLIK